MSEEKPSDVDNHDVKLLKPVAALIALLTSYIITLSAEKCVLGNGNVK